MNSDRSSVLCGKELQAETGCCTFCCQPSSQIDWFWVSCIEESSRSYRWTRWITNDPKKLNACFTLVQSLPAAIFCCAVVMLRDQPEMLFRGLDLSSSMTFFSDTYRVGMRSQLSCPIVASTAESERLRIKTASTNRELAGYYKISISKR